MQALPKLFAEKYGGDLKSKVTFLMSDCHEFVVKYCSQSNLLYGLESFVEVYYPEEDFIIFFDYIGNSKFYVSIFDRTSMDLCDDVEPKLMLNEALVSVEEDRQVVIAGIN